MSEAAADRWGRNNLDRMITDLNLISGEILMDLTKAFAQRGDYM